MRLRGGHALRHALQRASNVHITPHLSTRNEGQPVRCWATAGCARAWGRNARLPMRHLLLQLRPLLHPTARAAPSPHQPPLQVYGCGVHRACARVPVRVVPVRVHVRACVCARAPAPHKGCRQRHWTIRCGEEGFAEEQEPRESACLCPVRLLRPCTLCPTLQ